TFSWRPKVPRWDRSDVVGAPAACGSAHVAVMRNVWPRDWASLKAEWQKIEHSPCSWTRGELILGMYNRCSLRNSVSLLGSPRDSDTRTGTGNDGKGLRSARGPRRGVAVEFPGSGAAWSAEAVWQNCWD